MTRLPKKLQIYIGVIGIIAILVLTYLYTQYELCGFKDLMLWTALSIITESLLILIPGSAGVSVGFAISLACITIYGPLVATIVTSLGFTFRILKFSGSKYHWLLNTPLYKTLFNVSQSIIMVGLSGISYVAVGGVVGKNNFEISVIPISVALVVYLMLNSSIMAELMSILMEEKFTKIWMKNIKGIIVNLLAVGVLGIIIALAYKSYGVFGVILFFAPLLLARYSFKLYIDMRKVYMETITALTKAVEAKDPYTSGHASRVGEYAIKLAQELKLPDNKIEKIKTAAILHDIGKIGINDSILNKPGKLTIEEYDKIKEHPLIGAKIVDDIDFLKDVTKIIKYHHERYDGTGYPEGIDGENIPVEAAILSISDVFDAMTSDRPYRKALSTEEALSEIENNAGTQFHPDLANTFAQLVRKDIKKEILAHVN